MICAIYKSPRKADTYLYLPKRDDFSSLPDGLLNTFGTPLFVMLVPLQKVQKLAHADLQRVRNELADKGYYLQMPPPQEDLLKLHRQQLGLDD